MRLRGRQKGIDTPSSGLALLRAPGTARGHRSPSRCEWIKLQSPKPVSVTLKENYSIPERCLGMRDMLKKFKGKGAAVVPALVPPSPPYRAQGGFFFNKLCPAGPSLRTGGFRLVSWWGDLPCSGLERVVRCP